MRLGGLGIIDTFRKCRRREGAERENETVNTEESEREGEGGSESESARANEES